MYVKENTFLEDELLSVAVKSASKQIKVSRRKELECLTQELFQILKKKKKIFLWNIEFFKRYIFLIFKLKVN